MCHGLLKIGWHRLRRKPPHRFIQRHDLLRLATQPAQRHGAQISMVGPTVDINLGALTVV